jgi:hypothetical protein
MIMTFRKAIGLPLDIVEEKRIMNKMYGSTTVKIDPNTGSFAKSDMPDKKSAKLFTTIAQRLHSKYQEIFGYKNPNNDDIPFYSNHFTHLNNLITTEYEEKKGLEEKRQKENYDLWESNKPSMEVRKIFFSKNEAYGVIITKNQAVVFAVFASSFEVITQIDLPRPPVT